MDSAPVNNPHPEKVIKVNLGSMLANFEANMKAHQTSLFALSQQEVAGLKKEVCALRQELGEVRKQLDPKRSRSKEQEAKERHEYLVGQLSSLKKNTLRSPDRTTGMDIKGFRCDFRCKCRVCHGQLFYNKEGTESEQVYSSKKQLQPDLKPLSEELMPVLDFGPGLELQALMEEANIRLEEQEVREAVGGGSRSLEEVWGVKSLLEPFPPAQVQNDNTNPSRQFVQNREAKKSRREEERGGGEARDGGKRPRIESSLQEESTPKQTQLIGPTPSTIQLPDTKPMPLYMGQRLVGPEKQRRASSYLSSPTFSQSSIRPLPHIHSPQFRPILPSPVSHILHISPLSHLQAAQQTWNSKTQVKSPLPDSHASGAYMSSVPQPSPLVLHLPGNSSDQRTGSTPTALLTYRCGLCGEDLLSQAALERHIARDHSASRS